MTDDTPTSTATILHTEFNLAQDCWMYALSDGMIACAPPGNARIPAGLPLGERMQWAANQVARVPA